MGEAPSFRTAVEQRDAEALIASLSPDVVFHSPAVFQPYEGRETVGPVMRAVVDVLGPTIEYHWEQRDGEREILNFTAHVGGRDVEGVDILRYGGDGLVAELTVMIRP